VTYVLSPAGEERFTKYDEMGKVYQTLVYDSSGGGDHHPFDDAVRRRDIATEPDGPR